MIGFTCRPGVPTVPQAILKFKEEQFYDAYCKVHVENIGTIEGWQKGHGESYTLTLGSGLTAFAARVDVGDTALKEAAKLFEAPSPQQQPVSNDSSPKLSYGSSIDVDLGQAACDSSTVGDEIEPAQAENQQQPRKVNGIMQLLNDNQRKLKTLGKGFIGNKVPDGLRDLMDMENVQQLSELQDKLGPRASKTYYSSGCCCFFSNRRSTQTQGIYDAIMNKSKASEDAVYNKINKVINSI